LPDDKTFTLYFSEGWHLTNSADRLEKIPVNPELVDVVFEEKGVKILHSKRLQAIYAESQETIETVDADTKFLDIV